MRLTDGRLVLSATDLAHFLSCRHLTALDMSLALGKRAAPPKRDDPTIDLLIKRGQEHEASYVDQLRAGGKTVFDAEGFGSYGTAAEKIERTRRAMRDGVDVIVQGALGDDKWFGIADVIHRIGTPSALGGWSYEVTDTKLTSETKAGAILQLALYSSLVGEIQGLTPERFYVVSPNNTDGTSPFSVSPYRFSDFAAYYRLMRRRMLESVALGDEVLAEQYYPEPVDHCGVCRWWVACNEKRHTDDHASLVAGVTRVQRRELAAHGAPTLTAIAKLPDPIPFKPRRGSKASYSRVQRQAAVQLDSRGLHVPLHRLRELEEGRGLLRLPDPSPGDIFLDLEGDPFSREHGREYLFGVVTIEDGAPQYRAFWGFDDREERRAFEEVMDLIERRWAEHEGMHVYHYAPYEPSAFKRLMGRYASREALLDRLLRGRRFVDLFAVVRESMHVGVEGYSIKNLEPLYGFGRAVELREASRNLRLMEYALGSGQPEAAGQEVRDAIAGYNRDDCLSTWRLRDWLEGVRAKTIDDGLDIPRPAPEEDEPSEAVDDKARRVTELRVRLLAGVPDIREERNDEQQARWILAYLLDWHRREDKAKWWEYFRLRELPEEDLIDEPKAVGGLEFVEHVRDKLSARGRPTGSVVHRYRYPEQDMELEPGDELKRGDETKFAELVALDRRNRTLDLEKGPSRADQHPTALFAHKWVNPEKMEKAIFAVAERVAADGVVHVKSGAPDRGARDLLLRKAPRLRTGTFDGSNPDVEAGKRIVLELDETVLPIQGPPGAGKTYQGARLICALVAAGKRVGVTANSHKVIRNLLDEVAEAARPVAPDKRAPASAEPGPSVVDVRMAHKNGEDTSEDTSIEEGHSQIQDVRDNKAALELIRTGAVNVLGGTCFMWAREDFARSVDVLFVDEAGQMSLANAVAVSQAASSLVLLGDPQQLEQPIQGSHPDGVEVSALEHLLGGQRTITSDRGVFLDHTWRLAPSICAYTSEVFYESKLHSRAGLEVQRLINAGEFEGSGVFVTGVPHDGNRNSADEEVEIVAALVARLTAPGVRCVNDNGDSAQMRAEDVLVVSPYNAQVNRLLEALEATGVRVGTVDKFQGQEAPVVIYSMATSRPEDAPRGMEFLYSPNRLNVATSRARCAAILVASPALFEPECRSPRQMQLANGVCRFVEMAAEQPSPS